MNLKRICICAVIIGTLLLDGVTSAQSGSPFNSTTVDFLGKTIARDGYDLQPNIMYDSSAPPERRYMLVWFGEYQQGEQDIATPSFDQLPVGDRIYVSFAPFLNGSLTPWSEPRIIWKGLGGTTGQDETDDHLVGSPTVLRVNGTYYMFIESYGYYATRINRFFNFNLGDTWATNGFPDGSGFVTDWVSGYGLEHTIDLGFASLFRKAGMRPVYSGQVRYAPDNKVNRFLTLNAAAIVARTDAQGTWSPLNNSQPVFWVYENDQPGHNRKPLYTFFDPNNRNSYATNDPTGGGVPGTLFDSLLGFVPAALDTPDTTGCLQNRIRLLKSNDGINWTKVDGLARGGAIIAPMDESTSLYPHDCNNPLEAFDAHRAYGSGFPVAVTRNGNLELYFTDDTELFDSQPACGIGPQLWRITIPIDEIENPISYLNANRQRTTIAGLDMGDPWTGYFVSDIKWSEFHQRYFAFGINPVNLAPQILWSNENPNQSTPPSFQPGDAIGLDVPADRLFSWGGILGDESGHTLDIIQPLNSHTALHLIHADIPADQPSEHLSDLSHSLVFGFFDAPILLGDVNGDGTVDLLDIEPFVSLILTGNYQVEADVNEDGSVDLLDVSSFVDLLVE